MRLRWILPLFGLSLLALAATCGDGANVHEDSFSGISGYVTTGPQCPVVHEDSPCPDAPYVATIVIEDEAGNEVARAKGLSRCDEMLRFAQHDGRA